MAVDRDNTIYVDVVDCGLATIANIASGIPEVSLVPVLDPADTGPTVVHLDYSPWENALYALLPGLLERIDLETGTISTVATTGSLLRGGDGEGAARIFVSPDGTIYYANAGDLGRLTPEGVPARLSSNSFNHRAEHDCLVAIVRFDPAGEPVFDCHPTSSSGRPKFFATSPERGRDLRFDQMLTRTASGYTLEGRGESRTFNGFGRLVERTRRGVTETLTYTGELLTTYTDGFGGSVQFNYTDDKLTSIVDQGGNSTTFTVDGNNDLVQMNDSDGHTTVFTYDAGHAMQSRTTDSLPISYTWHGTGGLATATLPTGEIRQYTSLFDAIGASGIADDTTASVYTDGEGYAFTQLYSWLTLPKEITAAGETWDIVVQTGLSNLFLGGVTTIYDARRDDTSESVRVSADHDRIYSAEVNEVMVFFATYDQLKRPTTIQSYANFCALNYEARGLDDVTCNDRFYMDLVYTDSDTVPDAIDDYNGERWTLTRDGSGNIETITDPLGGVVTLTRNQAGFVTNSQGANNQSLGVDRDEAGYPTAFHLPITGESVSFTWQRVPTCVGCIEGSESVLSSITDGLSNTWSIARRADGTAGNVTDPLGQVRTFSHDHRRLLTGITGPGLTDVQFTRGPRGELTAFVIDGSTTTFTHDSANRWLTADGPDIDMSRTFRYADYELDELTSHPSGVSYTVSLARDDFGRLRSIGLAGAESFDLGESEGTAAVLYGTGDVAAIDEFELNQGGNLRTRWLLDRASQNPVVTHTLSHDVVHRLGSMEIVAGATTDTVTYTYDGSMPYLTSVTASTGALHPSLTFTHDNAGRLTNVGGDVTAAYTYDLAGRLSSTDFAGTFTYDAAGRLLSTDNATYTYEPRGTRASRADGASGEVWRYTFDSADRLTAVEKYVDGVAATPYSTVSLAYDPMWRLSRIDVDGTVTYLAWANDYLLAELDAAGNLIRQYVPMADLDDPVVFLEGGAEYFYVKGHTGNVHRVVDSTGAVVASYSYDGFGRVLSATGALAAQPRRFAGAYYVEALGLYTLRARWYDPEIGQFISPDPELYVAPFVHPYLYAANDPTRYIDPTGCAPKGGNDMWADGNGGPPTNGNWLKDTLVNPIKGKVLGDVDNALDIVTTLKEYGSDPVKNAEVGIKYIFDKTLLSHSPKMRQAANSFLDFMTGGFDFFDDDGC